MKYREIYFLLIVLIYTLGAKAQYQPQGKLSNYLVEIPEENGEIRSSNQLGISFTDWDRVDLKKYIDDEINKVTIVSANGFDSFYTTSLVPPSGILCNVLDFVDFDNPNMMVGFKLLLEVPKEGTIEATIYDIVLKTPESDKLQPAEELISDRVALNKEKTAMIAEKADYRMATIDFIRNYTSGFDSIISKYVKAHRKNDDDFSFEGISVSVIDADTLTKDTTQIKPVVVETVAPTD